MATLEDVIRIVSLQLGHPVTEHDHFIHDLKVESLDVMNIIVAVEEKFGIEIKESEIPNILTPASLYDLVASRK